MAAAAGHAWVVAKVTGQPGVIILYVSTGLKSDIGGLFNLPLGR